ncbi:hypothetical protein LI328DRAFT_105970 [Trichoderma asperelloides]|nr:hypothetical protein LI328DRAFT_105970 [Trichoderma asperelloides]
MQCYQKMETESSVRDVCLSVYPIYLLSIACLSVSLSLLMALSAGSAACIGRELSKKENRKKNTKKKIQKKKKKQKTKNKQVASCITIFFFFTFFFPSLPPLGFELGCFDMHRDWTARKPERGEPQSGLKKKAMAASKKQHKKTHLQTRSQAKERAKQDNKPLGSAAVAAKYQSLAGRGSWKTQ